jgi:CRP-like cAMP-binding protein
MQTPTTSHVMADVIERCPLLAGLSAHDLNRYCPTGSIGVYPHRGTVYSQGTRCDDLFCVLSGQVKLARVSQEGREFTTALLVAGTLFGPALGNSRAPRAQETATAKSAVSLWRIPAAEFHALLLAHPVVGIRVVAALAERQRQAEKRLECFAFKRTQARLAETLRELTGGFEERCEHGFGKHIRLTQQELADLVGASRPVVSTILNRLRKRGVLGYNREYVCVRAIEAVEQLIGE